MESIAVQDCLILLACIACSYSSCNLPSFPDENLASFIVTIETM